MVPYRGVPTTVSGDSGEDTLTYLGDGDNLLDFSLHLGLFVYIGSSPYSSDRKGNFLVGVYLAVLCSLPSSQSKFNQVRCVEMLLCVDHFFSLGIFPKSLCWDV